MCVPCSRAVADEALTTASDPMTVTETDPVGPAFRGAALLGSGASNDRLSLIVPRSVCAVAAHQEVPEPRAGFTRTAESDLHGEEVQLDPDDVTPRLRAAGRRRPKSGTMTAPETATFG